MIVRILGEGQLALPEQHLDELNTYDAALSDAVAVGDEDAFRRHLTGLLDRVRELATPVADHDLRPSDLILPAPDSTLMEVAGLLVDEGLIPG
ncbi:MAG TPA: hypothetical protein VHO29_19755 [Marmoricola sp.]|nr:hypothetical protein [Marmoricola sp.]